MAISEKTFDGYALILPNTQILSIEIIASNKEEADQCKDVFRRLAKNQKCIFCIENSGANEHVLLKNKNITYQKITNDLLERAFQRLKKIELTAQSRLGKIILKKSDYLHANLAQMKYWTLKVLEIDGQIPLSPSSPSQREWTFLEALEMDDQIPQDVGPEIQIYPNPPSFLKNNIKSILAIIIALLALLASLYFPAIRSTSAQICEAIRNKIF